MSKTTGVIRWEDPPAVRITRARNAGDTRRPWSLIAHQLREHAGEWAAVEEDGGAAMASTCARINAGVSWWMPKGSHEACTRTVAGVHTLYARYVGPTTPEPPEPRSP